MHLRKLCQPSIHSNSLPRRAIQAGPTIPPGTKSRASVARIPIMKIAKMMAKLATPQTEYAGSLCSCSMGVFLASGGCESGVDMRTRRQVVVRSVGAGARRDERPTHTERSGATADAEGSTKAHANAIVSYIRIIGEMRRQIALRVSIYLSTGAREIALRNFFSPHSTAAPRL